MKKPRFSILIVITCVFAAFLGGLYAGRNLDRTPVQVHSAAASAAPSESGAPTQAAVIDINTATAEQLQTLPGIGPVLAQRIIGYRAENGPFRTAGDLMNVEGIGTGTLEEILDLITVGG